MQVTLNPVDWTSLRRFGFADAFFASCEDPVEDVTPEECLCYDNGWESDSAIQYFQVAEALEHVLQFVDHTVKENLNCGIRRLLCENGHVDEFEAGAATEGHYWLSASPETTRDIWQYAQKTDWNAVCEALRKYPTEDSELMENLESDFLPFIKQHLTILRLAVSGNYGLLGHCG